MFTVAEIASDAKRILANCDDATLLNRLNYVVELLANESDWDPLVGVLDVNTETTPAGQRLSVTLPAEVETPLQVNIGHHPALARNRYFSFHLNGPGDDCRDTCMFAWDDKGDYPTLASPEEPFTLIGIVEDVEDLNAELWAYGYDEDGRWIRTQNLEGNMVDGYSIPLSLNPAATPPLGAPEFKRITRIRKTTTREYVVLNGFTTSPTAIKLGDYAPNETEPSYRRLTLSRTCRWARIIYRKRVFKLTQLTDLIPLHSPFAILMALKATEKMENDQLDEGEKYLNRAINFLTKEQLSRNPVAYIPVQVSGPKLIGASDRLE